MIYITPLPESNKLGNAEITPMIKQMRDRLALLTRAISLARCLIIEIFIINPPRLTVL